MSGIGGIIHWDRRPVSISLIRYMMQIVSHRGVDGLWYESSGHVGLGFALLAMKHGDAQHPQPIWLPDKSCAIVADARLYNRDNLMRRLGTVSWWRAEPPDAAIILAAYERWGVDLLDYLDGDFAFAIWDQRHKQVFAARDPFSLKPFFYYHKFDRFLFGSEPKQLLTMPAMIIEPDDDVIGELLLDSFLHLEKTFFKDIQRLKPAHYLIATQEKVVQRRWWAPDPRKEIWYEDPQEYYDQFRELLKAAVVKRLNTDFPILVDLSGGFDSSSIVVLADEYYRQNSRILPLMETFSLVFPGDPCDETPYIKAILDRVAFSSIGANPVYGRFSVDAYIEELWCYDMPLFAQLPALADLTARIMGKDAARILLSGGGGDEMASFLYHSSDLVRHGRFLTLIQESHQKSGGSLSLSMRLISGAVKGAIPETFKRPYRWLTRTEATPMPDWLSPQYAAYLVQHIPDPSSDLRGFRSQAQNWTWKGFNRPLFHWLGEGAERRSSWGGFEIRGPYCDRPLIEFVLAMPIEQRLKGERWRDLQRRGLAQHLPPILLQRKSKADFTPHVKRVVSEAVSKLEPFLFSSAWLSEPYISRESAENLFTSTSLLDTDCSKERLMLLYKIAGLETWLRRLSRYRENAFAIEKVIN